MKSELSKSFLKLPESKKYPRLFKLKTTALIVFILIAIVGIIDLSFFIYIRNNKEPSTNISFINKVVTQTTLLTEGDQVTKMIQNILQPYPASYFQYAQKLSSGPGSKLNLETLKNDIFAKKSKDLLFLFQLQGETQMLTNSIGLFTGASFPLPKDSDYVTSRDYYTLQSSSGFHSVVFSLQNNNFLNFNGTEVPQDILACKNYVLSQSNQYIEFFGLIRKNLFTADIKFTFGNSYKCFDKIGNAQQLVQKISSICGFDVERSALNVAKYEVYHLTNEKPKN